MRHRGKGRESMKGKSWKRRLSVLLALVLALQVIPIRFPAAGSFLGIRDAVAAVSTEGKRGKAVIFCQTNDSVLKDGPLDDGKAMRDMLERVDGFASDDIHVIEVDSESDDPRGIITEALETYLADNVVDTYTLFYYSGHGNADSQGSSMLALSDFVEDAVHASELREWLEQYKGQFLVMLDCCYSGGMVMGASTMSARTMALDYEESEEEWEEDPEEEMEEESLAEEFSVNFVAEFMEVPTGPAIDTEEEELFSEESSYEEPDGEATPSETTPSEATPSDADWDDNEPQWQTMSLRSRNSGYTSRFRIITAASREETASQNSLDAGELTQAVGHALGYDRYIGAYNVCAADVDQDHKVSMEELSLYVGKQPMDSQPVFYPENDTAALFTYSGDGPLTPAEFDAELVEPPVLGADGKASVKVKLKNLSSNETYFDVGVYTRITRGYQILPIVSHFPEEFEEDGTNCFRTVGSDETYTLSIGRGGQVEYELTDVDLPAFTGNPYFYLRINPFSGEENPLEDTNDYVPSSYQLFKFVLQPDTDMDPNAVTFRSPWMAQEYGQAQILYMKATEDSEDRNILPIILQFDEEPVGQNKRGEAACRVTLKVLDSSDQVVSVLAENHRPVYNWFDSSDTTFRHSTYTAYWDYTYGSGAYNAALIGEPVPAGEAGAFYKLQATVTYDDTRLGVKTVSTSIFLMESGSSERVIYEYTPFRTCTLEAGSGSYVLSDFHAQLLAMLEKGHIKDMESRALTYEIRSWDCGEDGVISGEEAAESSLPMERGRPYAVKITSKINEEDDSAVFSKDCVVHAAGHPVRNVEIASDGKSITFEVVHRVPRSESLDPDDVTLNTEGKLKPGGIIKSASVTGFGEEASFFIYCDGEVYELSEDGWEIPEGCRSFEFWVVLGEGDDYEIYAVEYVLGSSLTVEGGRITGENAQFSDNLLPGEKITVEAEIPYGKWFYKWEITEYPWGDDVEAEEGYIPQSAAIDSLYSAKAILTMGDKNVSIKAIYMDPDSHEDSDRHERQSSTVIRARKDGSWSLDPDGTWSYRVGSEKATGWQYAYYSGGPAWFSFNEKGQMETGWKQDNTYWYYLDPELGTMKTGWVQINGKWYYFNPASGTIPWGAMYRSSRTPDGYQVGEDGAWDGAEKIS